MHRCFGLGAIGKPRNIIHNAMRLMQTVGLAAGGAKMSRLFEDEEIDV